jgi:hypothetical protein
VKRLRKRKQLLLKLGVFLLLGTIINVAVAWGLAWYPASTKFGKIHAETACSDRKLPLQPADRDWPTHWIAKRHQRLGGSRSVVSPVSRPYRTTDDFESLLPEVTGFSDQLAIRESKVMSTGDWSGMFVCDARGWPVRSLTCYWPWWQPSAWPAPPIRGGIPIGNPTESHAWPFGVFELRALPYMPIWPGFAINTISYAAIFWLLWIAPGKIRRFIRIRRHRCPACGYEIAEGVGPRCSECGVSLARNGKNQSP